MWVAQIPKPAVPLASLHRVLYGYFPAHPASEPRPFVYRVERDSIILGSAVRPACDARRVVAEAGRTYQFDLIAKPANGGTRCVIQGNEARRDWLARNLRGAEMRYCEIHDMPNLQTTKASGHAVWLPVCRAIGTLTVTDPAGFTEFLARGGPGTGKAYGCGMWVLPELMEVSVAHRHPFERR